MIKSIQQGSLVIAVIALAVLFDVRFSGANCTTAECNVVPSSHCQRVADLSYTWDGSQATGAPMYSFVGTGGLNFDNSTKVHGWRDAASACTDCQCNTTTSVECNTYAASGNRFDLGQVTQWLC